LDKKNKKKFNLFTYLYEKNNQTDALPYKDEKKNLSFFFKLVGRNFGRLFSLNLYLILGNFGLFFVIFALSNNLNVATTTPQNPLFAPLYAIITSGSASFKDSLLFGIYGVQDSVYLWTSASYIILAIGIVLLAITYGPVKTGIAYIMRNIIKGEPIFMWDDFKYAIKRNLKQSLILGIIDLAITALTVYDIIFFYMNLGGGTMFVLFFYISIALFVVFSIMRFYLYVMLVTFDLSIKKMFKNALIFTALGFLRNALGVIGIISLVFLNYFILIVYIPIGIILPFIITMGLISFIEIYVAYPKIYDVMIAPYENEVNGDNNDTSESESLPPDTTDAEKDSANQIQQN